MEPGYSLNNKNSPDHGAGFKTGTFTNPVIRKLGKIGEQAADGEKTATYGGIGIKTVYFLLLTVAGAAGFFTMGTQHIGADGLPDAPLFGVLAFALLMLFLAPILTWAIRPAVPVIGTLYSVSQGILIAFAAYAYGGDYFELILLAFVITVAIVFIMYVLYSARIIAVTKKFRSVLATLLFTSILVSVALAVMRFIPATAGIVNFVLAEPVVSIGGSVIMIIVASLFLLSDFDAIEKTVEHRLPKKYEWAAAYGLAFTVIWLYLKVLNLLMKTTESNNK